MVCAFAAAVSTYWAHAPYTYTWHYLPLYHCLVYLFCWRACAVGRFAGSDVCLSTFFAFFVAAASTILTPQAGVARPSHLRSATCVS